VYNAGRRKAEVSKSFSNVRWAATPEAMRSGRRLLRPVLAWSVVMVGVKGRPDCRVTMLPT
jgi:hypothetical protein